MSAITKAFLISLTIHLALAAAGTLYVGRQPNTTLAPPPLSITIVTGEAPAQSVTTPPPEPHPAKARVHALKTKPVTKQPEVAPLATPPAPPTADAQPDGPTTTPSLQTAASSVVKEAEYSSALRNLIESEKVYPAKARRLHHQGVVTLRFTIAPDGTIHSLRIVDSSGSVILDEAAVALVRRLSGKLATLPGLPQRERSFSIPLEYRLN